MEELQFVVMEKNPFENINVIIENISGIFSRSRIGSKVKTNALKATATLTVGDSQKNKKNGAIIVCQK